MPVSTPCWRVWTYPSPAIVLGCSQRSLRNDIELRLGGRAELVERGSGGGAVLTGPWLVSASLILPPTHPWVSDGIIYSYQHFAQLHVQALKETGVHAHALSPHELVVTKELNGSNAIKWACFGSLSPWEVVNTEGRKLVGLAQRKRQTGVCLVAGTLLGATNWSLLCDVMGQQQDEIILRRRTVSVEEITGSQIEAERFASVLIRSLESTFTN